MEPLTLEVILKKIFIYSSIGGVLLLLFWKDIQDLLFKDRDLLKRNPKAWLRVKWKNWGEPILIAIALALLLRAFIVQAYKIPTGSMRPTFMEQDRILVDKVTYRFHDPERGDIIVFKYPLDKKKDFVKRLIAFPGEKVEIRNGNIYINGQRVEDPQNIARNYYYNRDDWPYGRKDQVFDVPAGQYLALGDNSMHSSDSRNWGFVPKENLRGRAFLIYWPLNRMKLIREG